MMVIPVRLPDDVHHAIGEMIERRRSIGMVSTGQVISELRRSFPISEHDTHDLENVIAQDAIHKGMHVQFETSMPPPAT